VPWSEGNGFTVDFGARYEGYVCDITRTISLGEADPWMRNVHARSWRPRRGGVRRFAQESPCGKWTKPQEGVIVAAGLGECFSHGLGHGIGLSIHEAPRLSFRSEEILEIGDVVTVEPGVYLEGRGGVRVEDNYLIEENGAVCLTESLPRRSSSFEGGCFPCVSRRRVLARLCFILGTSIIAQGVQLFSREEALTHEEVHLHGMWVRV
jgi:Xaa-Pro aminopeptidase